MKFKVGDKVIILENSFQDNVGEIVTIVSYFKNSENDIVYQTNLTAGVNGRFFETEIRRLTKLEQSLK